MQNIILSCVDGFSNNFIYCIHSMMQPFKIVNTETRHGIRSRASYIQLPSSQDISQILILMLSCHLRLGLTGCSFLNDSLPKFRMQPSSLQSSFLPITLHRLHYPKSNRPRVNNTNHEVPCGVFIYVIICDLFTDSVNVSDFIFVAI
jgi:hypothetical protein